MVLLDCSCISKVLSTLSGFVYIFADALNVCGLFKFATRLFRMCWIVGTNYGQGSTLRSPSGLDTAHWLAHITAEKTGLGERPKKRGSPEN